MKKKLIIMGKVHDEEGMGWCMKKKLWITDG